MLVTNMKREHYGMELRELRDIYSKLLRLPKRSEKLSHQQRGKHRECWGASRKASALQLGQQRSTPKQSPLRLSLLVGSRAAFKELLKYLAHATQQAGFSL